PGTGAVLHTGNPPLADEQIAYTLHHAGSSLLLFERNFADLVQRLLPQLTNRRQLIIRADGDLPAMPGIAPQGYERVLAEEEPWQAWPSCDENNGAILCYTSGTTGNPKGVLYSHRSIVLHALAAGLSSAFNFSAFDCIMPCSSLYHGTAWGV